jgi:DNA polymerase III subunit delta'
MAWNRIIGQERVKNILQKAIINERISHAYCLWGNEGTGKEGLAIEFSKIVNCTDPVITNSNIEACGKCASCKQSAHLQHPNIELVFALPTVPAGESKGDTIISKLSDDEIKNIQEQIYLKSNNYYHKITIPNAKQIKIGNIRELKKKLTLSPVQSGRRCIIVLDAEEITTEAANAFLKSLEEPHENVTIFLITSRQELLLQTILSRCQQIHCSSLGEEQIASGLMEREKIPEADAKLAAVFSEGSYTKALEYLKEDMKLLRQEMVNILRAALKKRNFRLELLTHIEPLSSTKDITKLENILKMMLVWMRDSINYIATNEDKNIINIDQLEILKKFASGYINCDFPAAIRLIEKALEQLRRNVQPKLVLISFFVSIREIFLN